MNKIIRITTKTILTSFLISVIFFNPTAASAKSEKAPKPITSKYQPQELLVKFKPGIGRTKIQSVARGHGATKIKRFKAPRGKSGLAIERWRQIKLGNNADTKDVLARLARHPLVEAVEFNFVHSPHLLPNDWYFPNQWALDFHGSVVGVDDADIDAPEAWDITTGSSEVIVAVIDTGIEYTHPDLTANIWINRDEVPDNGIDDDANGYIDDVRGYNFAENSAYVFDYETHGTHVAGIIGASSNNSIGVSGVSWNVQLMPVRIFGGPEDGSNAAAVNAILYAIDNGARVINASWGSYSYSQILADAIAAANEQGVLFVTSAGNDEVDNDIYRAYPASYDLPNIISVAASTKSDGPTPFTNYGRYSVDLLAPGDNIFSTAIMDEYKSFSGTSMAAPHVSGVAALLLSQDPTRDAARLKDVILNTVDPIHPNWRYLSLSGGRLNAFNALSCVPSTLALDIHSPKPAFTNAFPAEPILIKTRVSSCDTGIHDAMVTVTFDNGEVDIQLFDDGQHNDGAAGDGVYANTWLPQTAGKVVLLATATHSFFAAASDSREGHVRERMSYKQVPIPYNWIDTSTGTVHPLTDESNITIPIGFDFDFYGIPRSTITISDNGYLTFGPAVPYFDYVNTDMPFWELPNDIIAPFWDDFHLTKGGQVVSLLEGTAPNRRLTIAWVDVPHYDSLGRALDDASFQATLYEESGDIIFNYKDTDFGYWGHFYTSGESATVGLEDPAGEEATLYTFDYPIVFNETAIRYYRIPYAPGIDNRWPFAGIVQPTNVPRNHAYTFDGTLSYDPDDDLLSYSWNFGDGTTATGATPSHSYGSSGIYYVNLVVSDDEFESPPASIAVSVYNNVPIAYLGGVNYGEKNEVLTFSGSNSYDLNNDVLTYFWDLGDGTTANGEIISHSYSQSGTFTITLKVFDGEGWSLPVTQDILIENNPPVVRHGGPYYASPNEVIQFDGTGSYDTDNDPLTYRWDFGDGTTATGSTPTHQYSANGIYTVNLIVNDGEQDSVIGKTTAKISNQAPVADAGGPYTGFINQTIIFNGANSSDPDGDPLIYRWDFGDGTTGSGVAPTHVYASRGSYRVLLQVFDGSTSSGFARTTVNIVNQAPIANPGGPYSGPKNQAINFDGTGSNDPEGDALTYRWNFGDGTIGYGVAPSHTYTRGGSYTVTLTVNDGNDTSAPATTTVSVANQVPIANAGGPYSGWKNENILVSAAGSSDPDGDSLQYKWSFSNTYSTQATANFQSSTSGTFTIQLWVNDGEVDSVPVSTTVTVNNRPPVADAGADQNVLPASTVYLNGSNSYDPDEPISQANWQQLSGPAVTLSNPSALSTSFTAPKVKGKSTEVLVFQLTVTDADGASANDQVSITVAR